MENNWLFFNELKHTKVLSADKDKTGTIDDVLLDIQTGRIALYTLGSGGFLGMGEEKVALPPQAVSFRGQDARLEVEEKLTQTAPGTATAWPANMDAKYIDEVHRHYGYRPYSAE